MKFHREILGIIEKTRVLTTSELAQQLKISWNTAEKYLLELTLEGRVLRIKKSGVNLWAKKTPKPKIKTSASKFGSKIIRYTSEQGVITTSELAGYLNVSWNTAEKYLLELTLEGKMIRIKKAGVNLWLLK
jgi:Mn-dependent DtxR family transcriptional regulator